MFNHKAGAYLMFLGMLKRPDQIGQQNVNCDSQADRLEDSPPLRPDHHHDNVTDPRRCKNKKATSVVKNDVLPALGVDEEEGKGSQKRQSDDKG
jgi:hypothetical protein